MFNYFRCCPIRRHFPWYKPSVHRISILFARFVIVFFSNFDEIFFVLSSNFIRLWYLCALRNFEYGVFFADLFPHFYFFESMTGIHTRPIVVRIIWSHAFFFFNFKFIYLSKPYFSWTKKIGKEWVKTNLSSVSCRFPLCGRIFKHFLVYLWKVGCREKK